MKKIILYHVCFFFLCISAANASLPIPSYNIPVYYQANFQEKSPARLQKSMTKGRRTINVSLGYPPGGTNQGQTILMIYSLDGRDSFGPFTIYGDTTIHQDIDDREWGVAVQSEVHVIVNVWIDEAGPKNFQGSIEGIIQDKINPFVNLYTVRYSFLFNDHVDPGLFISFVGIINLMQF